MAMITSQQLTKYYDQYRTTEVVFTKDIIRTLAMDPRQLYIKCSEGQWPCIINSTSFSGARIIIGTKGGAYQQMVKKDPPVMSLRFCFYQQDGQTLSFFISCKVTKLMPYMNSNDLAIVSLDYTQRPPDDLIEMLGNLLDANINAVKRKDERIPINQDSRRKLGIPKDECIITVQGVPRHCILRDITFGGAKVVILGIAQFLKGKEVQMSLEFEDPHEVIQLKGTIVDIAAVEGRKDIVAASIQFAEQTVSLSYKIHINNYLTTARKNDLVSADNAQTDSAQGNEAK